MDTSNVADSIAGGGRRLRVLRERERPLNLPDQPFPRFPSLQPLGGAVTNLPSPLTRFVGRETELVQAAGLLAAARLLTLTGPGGCGKTRLALRLAAEQAERFPDGVWFVDLASLTDGEYVLGEVAMTIGVEEPERRVTLEEALGRCLSGRHNLVVLDNCEHVVAAVAAVTARLLDAAPELTILATSREPLGVGGEVTWAVPALGDPDAVALFTDRARLARPEFTLRKSDVAAVQTICRRLDGLPLAIELAAARTRSLAPARIASHLEDHLSVLAAGPRTAPRRQATLRASFEWSYELLSDRERALLRQLAVFAGSFDVDAALAVCPAAAIDVLATLVDRSLLTIVDDEDAGGRRYRMLETIRQFAIEQLDAAPEEAATMPARHCAHYLALAETAEPHLTSVDQESWLVRLGSEQDNLRGALAWARDRGDSETLVRLAVALSSFWLERSQWTECRTWLEAAENQAVQLPPLLRARLLNRRCYLETWAGSLEMVPGLANEALALARTAGDKHEEAFAIAALGVIAGMVMGADEARPYIEEAVALARSIGFKWGVAMCQAFFCLFRWLQADPEEPRRQIEEAIAEARAIGDRRALRIATAIAGLTDLTQARLADADRRFNEALAAGREAGHPFPVIGSLLGQGWIRLLKGDLDGASAAAGESAAIAKETEESRMFQGLAMWIDGSAQLAGGDQARAFATLADAVAVTGSSEAPRFEALPLVTLAEAQLSLGELDEARRSLDRATSLARAAAYTWILGRAGLVAAKLWVSQGEFVEAESAIHDAVELQRDSGDQIGLVDGLEIWAGLAAAQDSPKEAVRLWAAADSLRAELGYAHRPVDGAAYHESIAIATNLIGPDDFALAWTEGGRLSPDEAVAYAARGRGERGRPAMGWQSLTPSELEVVRLVGQHLTNPEIAARLFVSRATVKTHLIHVFAKVGVSSRSQLAAETIRRGLVEQPPRILGAMRTGSSDPTSHNRKT
jgi:predicted ATPase/DNA-binding CsgD family transcriptional regulator/tetratricopeptide (TPR) repeat protein